MTGPEGLRGTARLTRLAARRDRITLPAWIVGLSVFLGVTTHMFVTSLTDRADIVQEAALSTENPGLRMLGLTSGPSVGGATLVRDYVSLAVLAGLMSTFTVVRHTRQDEELGRAEVLGAGVVGRYAGLTAAVVVAVVANIALAVALGLAMLANGLPATSSFNAGASVAGVGLALVGVAAVTTQLASTSRGASGMAGAVLGLSFLVAGLGNMLGTPDTATMRVISAWPSWLSPLGWGQQMRPFGEDHWWPLTLSAMFCAVLLVAGFALAGRRDVGRGVWPEKHGDARASASLLSPTGLVWRLQRGAWLGWATGFLGFGLIFGAMSEQIQHVSGNARVYYTRLGGTSGIQDAYQASMIQMAGMIVAVYVVQIMLRLHADETAGTAESVLATGVTRPRWALGYMLNALVGAASLMLVFALGMGVTAGLVLGDTGTQVASLVTAALVQLPGAVVLGGAVLLVTGLFPRSVSPVSWALLLAALLLGPMFGPVLGLPSWVQDLSPFSHLPKAPAVGVEAAAAGAMLATCVTLVVGGILALRRRNLVLPA